ncbi:AfsR/SARP family transcriptional regulator [Streptomyces cavernae]|uniref:AfsR/SARP family transcriptional regulator n=1 Tax=Streptomyces cavernae TaxID=2259034 RepID=UPI000FEC0933|nr:BTAD domain-containing putative transcriptional regulator [Streptomyces cavernae]
MRTHTVCTLHLADRASTRASTDLMGHADLRFSVLGPVAVSSDRTPLELGPPQRRVLLTRLIVAYGRPVSMDTLCNDLWAGNPPRGATSAVHAHISRLRRLLQPQGATCAPHQPLTSGPHGYVLLIPEQAVDAVQFERSTYRTQELLDQGRISEARETVTTALGYWRGPALTDAADHPFAAGEIARLEELRSAARELHIAALLRAGIHTAAVTAAQDLTADQPLRETAWEMLIHALRLVGRPAEAIQAYERVSRLLMMELGLQPGPALRALQLAIRSRNCPAVKPRVSTTPPPSMPPSSRRVTI